MKMKKLLAGVLSATMVATMIPASMAFSGVSAEGTEVELSYDLTTEAGRAEWAPYTATNFGANYTEGNTTITEDENGVTFTTAGLNSYSIANPLKGNVTDGFSITVDATIPTDQALTQYEGFFGFNNHGAWQYFQTSNNGATLQANSDYAYEDWTGVKPGDNPFYYGLVGANQETMRDVHYALSVDETGARIYLNGNLVATYTEDNSEYVSAVTLGAANYLDWFNLGFNAGDGASWNWFNTMMTVTSVSFSTTTVEEKQAQEIADTLNVTTAGRQLSTDGTAMRFVARVDRNAFEAAGESLEAVGWLTSDGTVIGATPAYKVLTTVTTADILATDNTYAYTMQFTGLDANSDAADKAVVPCVQVNGYWFAYSGATGDTTSAVCVEVNDPVGEVSDYFVPTL